MPGIAVALGGRMRGDSGITHVPWLGSAAPPPRRPLATDARAEVCVIGAGMAGLSIAYHLVGEGRSVIVLDDGPIGGSRGRTIGHLSSALDGRYVELTRMLGPEPARLLTDSLTAAMDRVEWIVSNEEIDCDFERLDGYLFAASGDPPLTLHAEREAARAAGLADVELVARAPLLDIDHGPALRYPRQAQFDARRYVSGLARAIEHRGGRIHCGTRVDSVAGGRPARVRSRGGVVMCDAVVVTANTSWAGRAAVDAREHAWVTYAIAAVLPRGVATRALCWDTADPRHHVCVWRLPAADLLIVGGEGHHVGHAADAARPWAALESWARERFDGIGVVTHRWCGEILQPGDRLGIIGPSPDDDDNVFIAAGDVGTGMTYAAIAGMLVTDLIHRRDNPWGCLYDPARLSRSAIRRCAAAQPGTPHGPWRGGGHAHGAAAIPPGAGAVVRRGLSKVAVYRDERGRLHECSAVCPHLGCVVGWNHADATWDCPCHGSRFDPYGRLLNGPAAADLTAADAPEQDRLAS